MADTLTTSFSLQAPAITDLWRKPPSTDTFKFSSKTITTTVRSLKSIRVTVRANWTRLYDQGGIVILGPKESSGSPRWWIKAGVELYDGTPKVSSVATAPGTYSWSDWSIAPGLVRADGSATFELAVVPEHDSALWFYVVKDDGTKVGLREVTWWKALDPDEKIEVGGLVARPTEGSEEPQDLHVTFEDVSLLTHG